MIDQKASKVSLMGLLFALADGFFLSGKYAGYSGTSAGNAAWIVQPGDDVLSVFPWKACRIHHGCHEGSVCGADTRICCRNAQFKRRHLFCDGDCACGFFEQTLASLHHAQRDRSDLS